jgi:DNA-binding response OmpR family regulator
MTGLTETEYLVAALEAGGVDYVTKPIKPKEVLARMNVHMQGAREAAPGPQRAGRLWLRQHHGARQRWALMWQTALARELLAQYYGEPAAGRRWPPEPVVDWLRRHLTRRPRRRSSRRA